MYGYARQSPYYWIDPTGEVGFPGAVAGAIAGGVAGYIQSECIWGVLAGAAAGGFAGFVGGNYVLSKTASGLVSGVAGGGGYIAANYFAVFCPCGDEPDTIADILSDPQFYGTFIGGGAGGSAGTALGRNFVPRLSNRLFGMRPILNTAKAKNRDAFDEFAGELASGFGAASGELVGSYATNQVSK